MLFQPWRRPKSSPSGEIVEGKSLTKRIMGSLLELGLADKSQINSLGSGCHECDQLTILLRSSAHDTQKSYSNKIRTQNYVRD